MTMLDLPSFSYRDVLLLRKMVSVLEFAAAVQHSWSFSIYMKHLEVTTAQRPDRGHSTVCLILLMKQ